MSPQEKTNPTRNVMTSALTVLLLLGSLFLFLPPAAAANNPAADLDQCANGSFAAPVLPPAPCDWVNGNLGHHNSHYFEGGSVPFRMVMTNLATGPHTLVMGYDVMHSSKHAYDYLTSMDRISEIVDPCVLIAPCVAGAPFAIPAPAATPQPQTSFNALPAVERQLAIYNGVVTGFTYVNQGVLSGAQSAATVSVTFTAASSISHVAPA